ncbi:MAG: N-acetylmuramoyl-L-alanine amidase [Gammaproteobacteria bacterium]|nr:N-acetylmuramoyl-L-alanine amidase [Gammaproteobacteria bacterium]
MPLHGRARHAGPSGFRGRGACNDFSIGIELEGTDDDPYEDIQYTRLAAADPENPAPPAPPSVDDMVGGSWRHRPCTQDRSRGRASPGRGCTGCSQGRAHDPGFRGPHPPR